MWPASVALFHTRSEISCKSLEGREGLRQLIFHVTCSMKDVGSTIGCQRLAGRLVSTWLIPPEPGRGPAALRGDPAPPPVSASPGSGPRVSGVSVEGLGWAVTGLGQAGGRADTPRAPPAARSPGAT